MDSANGLEAILIDVTPELVGGELEWGSGVGEEKVMAVGDKLVPFSDKAVLEELLEKYRF